MSALDDILSHAEWLPSGLRGEYLDTANCWPTTTAEAARTELATLRAQLAAQAEQIAAMKAALGDARDRLVWLSAIVGREPAKKDGVYTTLSRIDAAMERK